jgi:uroporphyrinogen decarboxylase
MTSHRERVIACLAGEPTDRVPVALWRHFPVDDQDPQALAAAHLAFQRQYDFDFVKVTPASSFCLKDWGVQDVWQGDPEGTRRYTKTVISKPSDWSALPQLDASAPHLAAQLICLRRIREELGAETPVLQTVFSPLAQAKHLSGEQMLLNHMRTSPALLSAGLATIAASTKAFIDAAKQAGIDGIFFAVQHARSALLSPAEFSRFGREFDLDVLAAASGLWFNLLHLHGEGVYFEAVSDYPVQAINWHDRETPPSLAVARDTFHGALCGGLGRDTLVYRTQADIQEEAADAIKQVKRRGLILSTGCVVPIIAPHGNLIAARAAGA